MSFKSMSIKRFSIRKASVKKCGVSFTALFLSFFINLSAFGDDLEIYTGSGDVEAAYNPNVLFIMDTSGSMSEKDGTDFSRMQRVQTALNKALSEATNVNAGLMRFSDYGGPVLFPVTNIDQPIASEIIVNTKRKNDDAHEISGSVDLDDDEIRLTNGTNTVYTGLHFDEVSIPQGAVVTKAFIRFTSATMNSTDSKLTIFAEKTGNASSFENDYENISDRTRTFNSRVWESGNQFPVSDETILSADFTNVIQEIVDQSDWCGGNSLNIIIKGESVSGSSNRRAYTADKGDSRSPQLVLSYDESSATGCVSGTRNFAVRSQADNAEENTKGEYQTGSHLNFRRSSNNYVGLRFQDISIPPGARISSARIKFTSVNNYNHDDGRMRIRGVAQDNPSAFDESRKHQLRDKPKTGASVWFEDFGEWKKNNEYYSPNIKDVVQEIINRPGWSQGNALMLVLDSFDNKDIAAWTHKGSEGRAVELEITFEGNATPGSSSTVRDYLISKVNELTTNGFTPIVDTLYEAALYYGGLQMDYGRKRGEPGVSNAVRRSTRVSHRMSYTGDDAVRPGGCTDLDLSNSKCIDEFIPAGATYISPVTDLQCQVNNHIVLLSDGRANNNHSVGKVQSFLGTTCTGSGGEKCGIELVQNLKEKDTSVIGARVKTHTIGFAADTVANDFLNRLAAQGGGGFYTAEDSDGLLEVFKTIFRQVKDVNTTFVSPGVAVNQLNRLTHRDELYFALFRPEEGARWPGNLKKYKIRGDEVLDANNIPAVDSTTGFFSSEAKSYWSLRTDGNDVREGGAASKLDLVRNLYFFEDSPGMIFRSGNEFNESNTSITAADLALTSLSDPAETRERVLKWARGVDVDDSDGDGSTTDVHQFMGDPIHSQPVIVNYSETDSVVFVATNHGFLHAFDAETGEENYAIIPKELLSNLYEFYQNNSTLNHIYGLDGDMVYREADGKKYLYVGMRRGGNNYYVFDITSKSNPKLVFTIDGGEGDYANLGQSWSRPILTKIDIGGTVKDVMIIGGGYDEEQDDKTTSSPDSVGNSVFIIDANNGNLLWSASDEDADLILSDMKYSIPARISVIDRDNDGIADHMYVADMAGQLFRLDIYNGEGTSNLVKGGLMAQFGGATAEENRRFYYGPDVSEVVLGDEHYYAVAIGSGFRAGPLNDVIEDKFYMIKDEGVFKRDASYKYVLPDSPITHDSLYDATDHLLTSSDESERDVAASAFATKDGWFISLKTKGEKVLSAPFILDYQIFFTTYVPASSSESLCAPPTGNSRAYLVNMFNGNSVTDLNNNSVRDSGDRYAELSQTGIAPDTKILIENITKPVVCLGAECAPAVIEVDEDGNEIACGSNFECLARNIYGRFERVIKDTWETEVERN
uniref:PilC/PilY family type IV pilus protein n=1 Tax=Ningiella ruwaisensis TaxID=2364274 RepID=UPI001F4F1421|nr:PilC/PilY family type IV pilus protein [Ningiella ruwaisensis]